MGLMNKVLIILVLLLQVNFNNVSAQHKKLRFSLVVTSSPKIETL
jgi:hypothetical protein